MKLKQAYEAYLVPQSTQERAENLAIAVTLGLLAVAAYRALQ